MTTPTKTILIIALRPTKWIKNPLGGRASIKVLNKIRVKYGDRYFYAELPLSSAGEIELYGLLHELQPSGIISLGNIFWETKVAIEPYAISMPLFARNGEIVISRFVKSYLSPQNNKNKSRIGRRFENRIYLGSLTWAANHHEEPVVFLRIPGLCQRYHHYEEVISVLRAMEHAINQ
ncbi:MAG: hypothetical protein V3V31_00670 [Methylococcales bacterium]